MSKAFKDFLNEAKAKEEEILALLAKTKDVEILRIALMNRQRAGKDGRFQAEYFYGKDKKTAKIQSELIVDFMVKLENWFTEEDLLSAILKYQKEK